MKSLTQQPTNMAGKYYLENKTDGKYYHAYYQCQINNCQDCKSFEKKFFQP